MIVNVILPVTSKPEEYVRFIQREASTGVRFYVGVKEKMKETFKDNLKSLKNTEVHVFSDRTGREEMINSLHNVKMRRGKVMVVRRVLNEFEFSSLKKSETDITHLQTEHKSFFKWVKNIATKVVRSLFSFSFFEDISAICFGENMFELVTSFKNLSSASRLNRYVGVSISSVETREKSVVKDFHKGETWMWFVASNLVLIGSFTGAILIFIFCQISIVVGMLLVLWMIVSVLLWGMGMVAFSRSLVVGDLNVGDGEEFSVLKAKPNSKTAPNEGGEEKEGDAQVVRQT